jgi:hypothetical protein
MRRIKEEMERMKKCDEQTDGSEEQMKECKGKRMNSRTNEGMR